MQGSIQTEGKRKGSKTNWKISKKIDIHQRKFLLSLEVNGPLVFTCCDCNDT